MNSANRLRWSNSPAKPLMRFTGQLIPEFQPSETLKLWTQLNKPHPHFYWKCMIQNVMLFSAHKFVGICHTAVEKECTQGSGDFTCLWHSATQQVPIPNQATEGSQDDDSPRANTHCVRKSHFFMIFSSVLRGKLQCLIPCENHRRTRTESHVLSIPEHGQEQLMWPACG